MIYTCHIGPIDPERQRCIDRQREVYGDDWTFACVDMPIMTPEESRVFMDRYRLKLCLGNNAYMDSDDWPNEKWYPTENGIWLSSSWERIDYDNIFNVGMDKYIQAMLDWYDAQEVKPGIGWPLRWFLQHPEGIRHIPMDKFNHLYLTTSKGGKNE